MAGMLSTFAEFERDMIRERVIAGIASAQVKPTHIAPIFFKFIDNNAAGTSS